MKKNEKYANITIPTYIINSTNRKDRLIHIHNQFCGKSEFDITIVNTHEAESDLIIWRNVLVKVINLALRNKDGFILVCMDDHLFTQHYNKYALIENIVQANYQKADLLLGGIVGFTVAVPLSKNRLWIDWFGSAKFIIIYSKFFQTILDAKPNGNQSENAEDFLSKLTINKMVVHPFISIQEVLMRYDSMESSSQETKLSKLFARDENRLLIYTKAYERFLEMGDPKN